MPGVLVVGASGTVGSGGLECDLGFELDSFSGQYLRLYAEHRHDL